MSKCIKVKLKIKNGLMEIETPDGIVQGKRFGIEGLKKTEDRLVGFKISFFFIEGRENEELEMEVGCQCTEEDKEVLIIYADGKKWKIPTSRDPFIFKNMIVKIACWDEKGTSWLEEFRKYDHSRITIRIASKTVEFYQSNFRIIGEELKIIRGNCEYNLKVNTKDYAFNGFLYIDGYYDTQEQIPVLLLETKDGRFKIPLYRPFYIYGTSINLKKIN